MKQEKTIDYNLHSLHLSHCCLSNTHTHTHTHWCQASCINTKMLICYLQTPPAVGIYNYTPLGDLNESKQ